jgi:hypothetical protein
MVCADKIRRQIESRRQGQGLCFLLCGFRSELSTAENSAIEDRRWCSPGQSPLAVTEPTSKRLLNNRGERRGMAERDPTLTQRSDSPLIGARRAEVGPVTVIRVAQATVVFEVQRPSRRSCAVPISIAYDSGAMKRAMGSIQPVECSSSSLSRRASNERQAKSIATSGR